MKPKALLLCALLSISLLPLYTGCANTTMSTTRERLQPAQGKALVTFIRSAIFFGDGGKVSVWDGERLVGVMTGGTSVEYLADAGEHLFVGDAESYSYVRATLDARKRYYILVAVYPGVITNRIALRPLTKEAGIDTVKLEKKVQSSKLLVVDERRAAAYEKKKHSGIKRAIAEYEKGAVKYLALEASDGV